MTDEAVLAILLDLAARGDGPPGHIAEDTGLPLREIEATGAALSERGWLRAGSVWALLPDGRQALRERLGLLAAAVGDPRPFVEECPTGPIDLRAVFRDIFCFAYAVDPAALRGSLPPVLEPDLTPGAAFVTVLFVAVADARPSWTAPPAGQYWYEVSVRAHVMFRDWEDRPRRGVFFLWSYLNSPWLALAGHALREFRFHNFSVCPILMAREGDRAVLACDPPGGGRLAAVLDCAAEKADGSIFPTPEAAREGVVEAREAVAWVEAEQSLYVLEIEGDAWTPRPVRPVSLHDELAQRPPLAGARLDSVWWVRDVALRWKPMRRERVRRP